MEEDMNVQYINNGNETIPIDTKVHVFHQDAGHGWLAVKRKELANLGILDKISSCSYQKGKTVYLEEDCDFSIFVEAMKAKGLPVAYRYGKHCDHSPIRSYNSFEA
jgi:hypothetical protein